MMEYESDRAKYLMSESRKKYHDPEVVLNNAGATQGMVIADLGSGPGFFTVPIAKLAGENGLVYAVDGNQVMLSSLQANLAKAGVNPKIVKIINSDVCNTAIPQGSVDLVLFANVLHEVTDRKAFFQEVKRISKSSAVIVDVDWKKIATEHGPPLHERLSEVEACAVFEENGFKVIKLVDVGPFHYELIGKPTIRS
jgi:ubiquinone/menaquinone biosynthesis C-methylase UbiE